MDNYDHIAQDLKLTIDEYKHNLESLKDRFADIGNIIDQLDQLKLQAQHSGSKGDEFLVKVANLELKHAELSVKLSVLTEDYENALTNLKTQLSEWNKSTEVIVQDASSSITDLRADYHDKLNKAVADIALQAKQDASSLDQYLQQFSKTLLTQSAQKIDDLRNAVMLDLRHTRKINIAGFIVLLAFIIGLILYLVLSL